VGPGERFINPKDPPTAEKELKRMVCSADSIAVVLFGQSESSFSSHRDWVYTDYLARVQAVIKHQRPIDTGHLIVIGMGGGELEIAPGKRLVIMYEPRPTKGKEYLSFLRHVPDSGQYINCGALFSIDGEHLAPVVFDDDRFLDDISRNFSLTALSEFARNQSCPGR